MDVRSVEIDRDTAARVAWLRAANDFRNDDKARSVCRGEAHRPRGIITVVEIFPRESAIIQARLDTRRSR